MKRETGWAFFLYLLSMMIPLALPQLTSAQDGQSRPGPVAPSDVLGSQLIAWSEVQKPQPIQQAKPALNRPEPQSDRQPAQTANGSSDPGATPPQSFVYRRPEANARK